MTRAGMLLLAAMAAFAPPAAAPAAPAAAGGFVEEAACRIVENAARATGLPIDLLTRLVWTESRFRADVTSPKGAQGIAQFMPGTAAERGLADPFDPEQAIPKAARLLVDLQHRFGNIGLAAAAYNAGPNRIADWLAGSAGLPIETRNYVFAVTGRTVDDWAAARQQPIRAADRVDTRSCVEITASLRSDDHPETAPVAPWGVQLSGNFSKAVALASFSRTRQRFAALIGDKHPMILGGILRSRGTRPFYRVLLPAATRAEADRMCQAIQTHGGACVALRT
ncbi:MAG TPA: lytic transglycosylase domain-containing protein [Stellaceae bacterium]|nr:lytic transglycosylase domain-containing protein [Stellaceae bacterium]